MENISELLRLPESDIWLWRSGGTVRHITPPDGMTLDNFELLPHDGLVLCPHDLEYSPLQFYLILQSQMLPSRYFYPDNGKSVCMATPESIPHATKVPVLLGSFQDFPEMTKPHPYPYPPAEHGTSAVVLDKEQYHCYVKDLPPEAQERQKIIRQIIEGFQAIPAQTETFNVSTDRLEELQIMLQELAQDYYNYHLAQTQEHKSRYSLPPMTSTQRTGMPSNNGFRGIEQSLGPGLRQPSLWNHETAEEQHLTTPNGSLLKIRGQDEYERKALYEYINGKMGPEGLKHLLILIDTYYVQTGGKSRLVDAQVSPRQLLIRMGYSETQADDINERRKLVHTILYLARTWVTATETRYEENERPKGKGQKRKKGIEYTPLLVVEKIKSSPDGGLDVPDEIKFHLGEDFYNNLFGEHKQFFTLPTAKVLGYHAQKEQQELCLVFYLSNMIICNHPRAFGVSFYELLLQSGLQNQKEIEQGHDRTRSGLRVIYALEQLEIDDIICRLPHDDIDIILAAEYFAGKCFTGKNKDNNCLSPKTLERIKKNYYYVRGLSVHDIQTKRRVALQRLLKSDKIAKVLYFKAGTLLRENAQTLAGQKAKAIETNERAQIARVVKAATKIVKADIIGQNGKE